MFERFSKQRQSTVVWLYLPMPKGEDITALGVRLRQWGASLTTQKIVFQVLIAISYLRSTH
jgi:hypothetical protein